MANEIAVKFPELKRYEGASYLPISRDAIDEITADMMVNGYDSTQPIIVKGEHILDGWHRYEAAKRAKVQPVIQKWDGDPNAFTGMVARKNIFRRHLSPDQKAVALITLCRHENQALPEVSETLAMLEGVTKTNLEYLRTAPESELTEVMEGASATSVRNRTSGKTGSGSKKTKGGGNPVYELTKQEAASVAFLSTKRDIQTKKLLKEIFSKGLALLLKEDEATATGN